jgi:DNA polymerase III epsilon subunit-like protein
MTTNLVNLENKTNQSNFPTPPATIPTTPEIRGKFLIVDVEATGLHPAKHGVIELAAVALDEHLEILDTFVQAVKPPADIVIDPMAMKINNFDLSRCQSAPDYRQTCLNFLDFVRQNFIDKPIMVGQFYPFDYAYLDHLFSVSGYDQELSDLIVGNEFIDTKALALAINQKAKMAGREVVFQSVSLSKPGGLAEYFQVETFQAHTALGDAMATREVLIGLLNMLQVESS